MTRAKMTVVFTVILSLLLLGLGTQLHAQTGGLVYAVGPNDPVVSGLSIDPTTGLLTPNMGSPYPAGVEPMSVAVHPSGRFVYVSNLGSVPPPYNGTVSAYAVDTASGALTEIAGSPFPAAMQSVSIAADPLGRFVYVANCGGSGCGADVGSISAYIVDPATGALTEVSGSPFAVGPAGRQPSFVTVDATGQFVYLTSAFPVNSVSGFRIDAATGVLTAIDGSPFSTGTDPRAVTVDPSSQYVYVANGGPPSSVSAYTLDPTSGALTEIGGSPFPTMIGGPFSVVVDPTDRFVYLTGALGTGAVPGVDAYLLSGGGTLMEIPGSPFRIFATDAESLALSPMGQFAYVGSRASPNISVNTIDAMTGALTEVGGSPSGVRPRSMATTTGPQSPPASFH